MDDLYVFNNPWSLQANEKHTTYCAMMRLGMPIPETWMLPPKAYEQTAGPASRRSPATRSSSTSARSASRIGYPLFMKPYDGGGWGGVSKIDDEAALRAAYEESGTQVMHLQAAVIPYDLLRALHRPRAADARRQLRSRSAAARPLHGWTATSSRRMRNRSSEDITLTINAFFGWDFNSCEALAARTASGTRSTSRMRVPTRRSPPCTTTSRGW